MSLERVIADQQITIDHLNERLDSAHKTLNTMWTQHNELFESFARLIDSDIPVSVGTEYRKLRHECRVQMREAGYCLTCYNFVCECEGQYD